MIEFLRSTCYYRSTSQVPGPTDEHLVELINGIQDEPPGYGNRRVSHELRRRNHAVDHKRVARVMAEHGLGIKRRRRFVRTTDSDHDGPIFPNLYRNVIPAKPDLVWVADITHLRIAMGFCYLAAIGDACSRKIVGYAISMGIDTPLALAGLQAAIHSRRPARGCIHQTDRGTQYATNKCRKPFKEAGFQGLIISAGNSDHSAQAASFMKTIKVEQVYSAGSETFADVAALSPRFIDRVYNAAPQQATMPARAKVHALPAADSDAAKT